AAAAMVSAPPLFRNVDLLPEFFRDAAEAGLPLMIQDEPAATGVVMPATVLLACVEAAGARTIKLEDPPTPPKIPRLLSYDPALGGPRWISPPARSPPTSWRESASNRVRMPWRSSDGAGPPRTWSAGRRRLEGPRARLRRGAGGRGLSSGALVARRGGADGRR